MQLRSVILQLLIFSFFGVYAQTDVDALRFSQNYISGSARSMGFGNASTSLGADFTSSYTNPAGIGLYRSFDFSVSTSLLSINNESSFLGNDIRTIKYNFNINSIGLTFSSMNGDENDDWKGVNFALGVNRVNDFHRKMSFSGFNNEHSILDYYIQQANSNGGTQSSQLYNSYPFDAGLAWDAYLINPIDDVDTAHYNAVVGNGGIMQSMSRTERGGIHEWDFSFATNYKDKLFLGLTLGVPILRYKSISSYVETDVADSINGFNSLSLTEDLSTYGAGFNAKFGYLYKLNKFFRIGGAIHTPTIYDMEDDYVSSISSDLDSNVTYVANSPMGEFRYHLYTPWKASFGISAFFGKRGFVAIDYEFIDYSLSFYDFSFFSSNISDHLAATYINNTIGNKYGQTNNFKIGTELLLSDQFVIRMGYNYYGDPFSYTNGADRVNRVRQVGSLGFGFKEGNSYLDFAYTKSLGEDYYQKYSLNNANDIGVNNSLSQGRASITLGIKI